MDRKVTTYGSNQSEHPNNDMLCNTTLGDSSLRPSSWSFPGSCSLLSHPIIFCLSLHYTFNI